jgi:adenylate kinase family enzyme
MRGAVFGTSGSGKSTFAGRLAAATGIARIELDEINWRPGWYDRSNREPEAFAADVRAAIAGDAWVCAGGYSKVRPLILARAQILVWLDLPRAVIMRQVIARSLGRLLGRESFPGCREDFWSMLGPDHPIRWAWTTHARRRRQGTEIVENPAYAHLEVIRCRSRREVKEALALLTTRRGAGERASID